MKSLARTLAVLMAVLSISSFAGIRSPGKYYGVVIFDRWDTCYIYSGVYLMYVSQRVKEPLRKHQGQAMVIDALRVYQPMNPGDGRIDSLRVIGAANAKRREVYLDGLSLKLSPDFAGSPKFFLCGYGGGVHEDKSLASNIIAFDVNASGRAVRVNLSNR